MAIECTPNKVTALRVVVGFAAVSLFGRGAWGNLAAVALTVTAIALDALDGHIARKKKMATQVGAQLDIWSQAGAGTEVEISVPANLALQECDQRQCDSARA